MSVFTNDADIEVCIECDAVLKHKNDIESFCPECGHIYNSDLDTIKYKTRFTTVREIADDAEPMIVNMSDYGKAPIDIKHDLPPDPELKKYGTTILSDEVTIYDDIDRK